MDFRVWKYLFGPAQHPELASEVAQSNCSLRDQSCWKARVSMADFVADSAADFAADFSVSADFPSDLA